MVPSQFSADLINFTFSVFPDPSGRVGKFFPDLGDGEKLAGTLKKGQVDTSTGTLSRAKTKKTLFHYIYPRAIYRATLLPLLEFWSDVCLVSLTSFN